MNYVRLSKIMPTITALIFFIFLTIVITYPLVFGLGELTVFYPYTDAMLEGWTLKWNIHSLLTGPAAAQQLWNTNIFYPYPNSLAFTEHLLPTSFLLLPFILLSHTPLTASNLGALLTTVLSGWGVYLLVTWLTGNRWAGLVAGLCFAIAPFRTSHINQLHLLTTQWIPFAFLALARFIKLNRTRDLLLLIIFTNLQFLSVINYAPLAALALGVWGIFYLVGYHRLRSGSLWLRLAIFGAVTLALNWPILQLYQEMSALMGITRTLGDARVYGAFIINYILPVGNSLLYGRWLHLPTHITYLFPGIGIFVSTFPGLVVLALTIAGTILAFKRQYRRYLTLVVMPLLVISLVGFMLSFGANDLAFGAKLTPLVAPLLPYPYLYNFVPFLQGLRVPIRFALLPTFGLTILAGFGFALLGRQWWPGKRQTMIAAALLGGLILVEHLPAPLPVQTVAYGGQLPAWLAANTPTEAVILELPYYLHTKNSNIELEREYQYAGHWRRLVNGASGFKPAWLVQLGYVFDGFPDWRSFDLARQMGINYLVLHHNQYNQTDWDNLVALLPGYLPAVASVDNVGDDLVLRLKPPACQADSAHVQVDAANFPALAYTNTGPATFFADPRLESRVTTPQLNRRFLEPLFILPGQAITVTLPEPASDTDTPHWQVELANLHRTLKAGDAPLIPQSDAAPSDNWQPVQLRFANGAVLKAASLNSPIEPCGALNLSLQWNLPADVEAKVRVGLIDRFQRNVISNETLLTAKKGESVSTHRLPLAETVPPGQYQLSVRLASINGEKISALGPDGAALKQPPTLPVVIRPGQKADQAASSGGEGSSLANGATLVEAKIAQSTLKAGQWVRFTLTWRSETTPPGDFTVFTQFIGPDGQVWGQHDNPPVGGWYPTLLWRPGEIVTDDYAVRLDPAAPPGDYRLVVGMYNPTTGERVAVTKGTGRGQNFVEVGGISVTKP